MSFLVFAIHTIPDTDTGARRYNLGDLDDKSAAKAMHHLQQQSGAAELPLYMQRIAAVTTIYRGDGVSLDINSFGAGKETEEVLLKNFYKSINNHTKTNVVVSWDALSREIPLLMYRCLKNEVPENAVSNHNSISLSTALTQTGLASTSQQNVMSLLGLETEPLMSKKEIWKNWLNDKTGLIERDCTFRALDTYRIYIRHLMITNEVSKQYYEREMSRIDKLIEQRFGGYHVEEI